jgi:hypothetical protein
MTVYVHFHIATGKQSVRLHNVAAVVDHGTDAIRVDMIFADDAKYYTEVSHVALTPERGE